MSTPGSQVGAATIRRFRVRADIGMGSSVHMVSRVLAGLAVALGVGDMVEDERVRPDIWSVTDEDARRFPEVRAGDEIPVILWQGDGLLSALFRVPGEALPIFGEQFELEQLRFYNPLEAVVAAAAGSAATAAAGALGYLKFLNTRVADRRKADAQAAVAEQEAGRRAARADLEDDVLRAQTDLTRAQAAKTHAEAAQIRADLLRDLADYVAARRPGEDWSAALPLALDDEQAV